MLGSARTAGRDPKAIMLGTFGIGAIGNRIVKSGLDNGGFEIVTGDAARYAPEEGKGAYMQAEPGFDLLVADELHILVTAPGEGHDEGIDLAEFAVSVCQAADFAEIHLRFFTGLGLDAHADVGRRGLEGFDEAIH